MIGVVFSSIEGLEGLWRASIQVGCVSLHVVEAGTPSDGYFGFQ